jgi:hypothetical protein
MVRTFVVSQLKVIELIMIFIIKNKLKVYKIEFLMIEFFSKIIFLESSKGFWKVVYLKALKIIVVGPAQRSINLNVDNVINYVNVVALECQT